MSEQNATDTPDPVLIQRAKQGDPQAFGVLYERYVDAIFRYIRTRVSDVQTAEDLSEAVFLRAFEAIERYRDKGLRYSAFLYQVARNILVDHYRQSQEDLPLEDQVIAQVVLPVGLRHAINERCHVPARQFFRGRVGVDAGQGLHDPQEVSDVNHTVAIGIHFGRCKQACGQGQTNCGHKCKCSLFHVFLHVI